MNITSISDSLSPAVTADIAARSPAGTDVTAQVQAAVNAAQGSGHILYFPEGVYRLTAPITVKAPLRIMGSGVCKTPPMPGIPATQPAASGTVFLMDWTAPWALNAGQFEVTSAGFYIEGCEFFSSHQTDPNTTPWTAGQVPAGILVNCPPGAYVEHPTIKDILIRNLNYGVVLLGGARPEIDGLWGQAFGALLYIDGCYDCAHISKVHSWPFWQDTASIVAYQLSNSAVIVLGRADQPRLQDIFGFQVRMGIKLQSSAYGSANPMLSGNANLINVTNVTFDDVALPIINVCSDSRNGSTFPSMNVSNFTFLTANHVFNTGIVDTTIGVLDSAAAGATAPLTISLSNGTIQSPDAECVRLEVPGSSAMLSNVRLTLYNANNIGRACLSAGPNARIYVGNVLVDTSGSHGAPVTDVHAGGSYAGSWWAK